MSSLKKLYEIFTPRDHKHILILFLMSILSAFTQALGVASIFPFINTVMSPDVVYGEGFLNWAYETLSFNNVNNFLVFLGSMVLVLIILSSITGALTTYVKAKFVSSKNHTLSLRLLEIYLYKPYSYFLRKNSSELSKNVLSEINELSNKYILSIFDIVINGLIFIILLSTLLFVDVMSTIIIFGVLFITYGTLNLYTKRKLRKLGIDRFNANHKRHKLAYEAISSIKISKVMSNENFFLNSYSKESKKLAKTRVVSILIGQLPNYGLDLIAFGGLVLFVLIKVINSETAENIIPLISLFALAGYRMKPAINKLYAAITHLHYNQEVLDKIHYDMIVEKYEKETVNSNIHLEFNEEINIRNIDFMYEDSSEKVLKNVSLKIKKNSIIGFVGSTGSGKTTLVDIIMGLHKPTKGCLEVDNTQINYSNVKAWQKKIGYVPQDIYLSDDTLAHNIAFGIEDKKIDLDKVKIAAKISALDQFIENELPSKYDTKIGDRGVRLSGGQRQRIGLARALYRNPDVLILDEATSALDGATEQEVLNAIQSAAKSRTVVMIAHRLTTLRDCDQIFLLEKGQVIAAGTYSELSTTNRKFMKMAKMLD